MSSRFRRNRAPGWGSSEEEAASDDSSSGEDESDDEQSSSKRSRTNDQTPEKLNAVDGKSINKKTNNIWGDVLADQQLTSGLSSGVNVMDGDTFVARGAETYDCAAAKEKSKPDETSTKEKAKSKPKDEAAKDAEMKVETETMEKADDDDDPFGDAMYKEGPDLMAAISNRGNRGGRYDEGSRKRPWPRGGGDRRRAKIEEGTNDDEGSVDGGGDRGKHRGQFRGQRGRGRGQFSRGGGVVRTHWKKISLNREDTPKNIALAISESLREKKTATIVRALEVIGADKAIEIYNQTIDIENSGGMMTLSGDRRRTSGGVFLFLLRGDNEVTDEQKTAIFGAERDEFRQQLKAKRRFGGEEAKTETMNDDVKPLKEMKEVFLEEARAAADRVKKEEGAGESDSEGGNSDDVMIME